MWQGGPKSQIFHEFQTLGLHITQDELYDQESNEESHDAFMVEEKFTRHDLTAEHAVQFSLRQYQKVLF